MTTVSEYDVAVIGGGPGGYVAGIRAGQLGLKVLRHRKRSAGRCLPQLGLHSLQSPPQKRRDRLLRPPRRSVRPAVRQLPRRLQRRHEAQPAGRGPHDPRRRLPAPQERRRQHLREPPASPPPTRSRSPAPMGRPPGSRARNIIIATGARPRSIPPLPVDGERIITSRESIVAEDVPDSIAIVGGGAIGVEFAYIYRMYGAEVTVIELLPHHRAQRGRGNLPAAGARLQPPRHQRRSPEPA